MVHYKDIDKHFNSIILAYIIITSLCFLKSAYPEVLPSALPFTKQISCSLFASALICKWI